jgi:hypothetical protein
MWPKKQALKMSFESQLKNFSQNPPKFHTQGSISHKSMNILLKTVVIPPLHLQKSRFHGHEHLHVEQLVHSQHKAKLTDYMAKLESLLMQTFLAC